jgi:pimeloyl-ACP methyl ester carboxylesterase
MTEDDIEAAAQDVFTRLRDVRRRPIPRVAYAFRDLEPERVETSVGAIAAWRVGPGPAVLLVHGWEDDHSLWDQLIETLLESMISVVALDLPAHGLSDGDRPTLAQAGEALAAVASALGPVRVAVTHSFGGLALVRALLEHGLEISQAVLIAPPVSQERQWRVMQERYGVPAAVMARVTALAEAHEGRPLAANDLVALAAGLRPEALILHSQDDEQCPADGSRALAQAWPNAQLMILDGLGHRDIARDAGVCGLVRDFLT